MGAVLPLRISAPDADTVAVVDPRLDGVPDELRPLLDHFAKHGEIPESMLGDYGERLGISGRQLRRRLKPHTDVLRGARARVFHIGEGHLQVISACNGNLAKAHLDLLAGGHDVPASYQTFWAACRRDIDPPVLAYFREGADGMKKRWTYLRYEAEQRAAIYYMDHFAVDLDVVIPGRHPKVVRPWVTLVEDDRTRRIMAAAATVSADSRPNARVVVASIAEAVRRRERGDGAVFGGIPSQFRWDQAVEFASDLVTAFCARLGADPKAVRPYSGHLKGKEERLGLTFKNEFCAPRTGYVHGAKTWTEKQPFRADPLHEPLFRAQFQSWVDHYNSRRPHSSLGGRTPDEVWIGDQALLRFPADALLHPAMLESERNPHSVHKGIRFDNRDWVAAELMKPRSEKVNVRYPLDDRSFIEVFDVQGRYLCRAVPASGVDPGMRDRILATRREQYALAREVQEEAARMRARANEGMDDDAAMPLPTSTMTVGRDHLAPSVDDLRDLTLGKLTLPGTTEVGSNGAKSRRPRRRGREQTP